MKGFVAIVVLMMLTGEYSRAGVTSTATAAVPSLEDGFWVIVTRATGPAWTIVKFFDLKQHLIYEERLDGVRLNENSRRTRRMLNKTLRTVLAAWQGNGWTTRDQGIVAMRLK